MKKFLTCIFVLLSLKNFSQEKQKPFTKDTLFLMKGEKIFLELQRAETGIMPFRKTDTIHNPSSTLSISFSKAYIAGESSLLNIKNPFDKKLFYKVKIGSKRNKQFEETTVTGITPKNSAQQIWGPEVVEIMLYDFSFIQPKRSKKVN